MTPKTLTCFKAYDIRGEINVNIDEDIAYRIGRAVAQHFYAQSLVIGFDARKTSPSFAAAAAKGAMDTGCDALDIGLGALRKCIGRSLNLVPALVLRLRPHTIRLIIMV